MITKRLLKQEIDKVREEHLTALYNIIKIFELPAGAIVSGADTAPKAVAADEQLNWEEFIQETYGCLRDDPIERGGQGDCEIREVLE